MTTQTNWIHPAFAEAVSAAAAHADHKGALSSTEGEIYIANECGVTLCIRISEKLNTPVVAEARHEGATDPALAGVLDTFCHVIEDLPLREAADHGAIHAMEKLLGDPLLRPVSGIVTPRSSGAAFRCCENLIRLILTTRATKMGDLAIANFWNPPLSMIWRSSDDKKRLALLEPLVEQFRAEHSLAKEEFWVEAIDKMRRVIIGFGPTVDYAAKPSLLMRFEVNIRQATGNPLEVFMAEAKDTNSIRRLTQNEEIP